MALSVDQLHQAIAPARKEIPVPEWGGDVVLVAISTDARLDLRARLRNLVKDCPRDEAGKIVPGSPYDQKEARNIGMTMLALSLADDAGVPAFTFEQLKDAAITHEAVMDRLLEAAYDFNGFNGDAVENAAKKSDASTSDS